MKKLGRFLAPTLVVGSCLISIETPSEGKEEKVTKIARYQADGRIAYGVVEGDRIHEIAGDLFGDWKKSETSHTLESVKILVPTEAAKVIALAGNYKSHLGTVPVPEHPEPFFKLPTTLIAQGETILIPEGTEEVHPEAELVVVIGKKAKNVPVEKALDHVLGITCGNDISARDWQKADRQWWRAKGSDTFGPCGPFIVSGLDYNTLDLELRLNGEVKQHQNTADMIHNPAEIVSWISRHVTLEPGDLIYTGTPGTTGPMKPGDVVEVELEGVGILRNTVGAARE